MPPKIVAAEDAGARLDQFLARLFPSVSRAKLQRAVRDGRVRVSGRPAKPGLKLAVGDAVDIENAAALTAPADRLTPEPETVFNIIHSDGDIIVVDKPSGLQVHPINTSGTGTLANGLIARFPEMAGVGESPERPGIMHRLDRDASGLMVIARGQDAYASLKRQFQKRSVNKEYLVLTAGRPPQDSGTIALAIGRSASGSRMAARTRPLAGDRPAVTHYRVIENFPEASLVAVKTETGRTHQIRAHFQAIGHPVAGDHLYQAKKSRGVGLSPRLFLHAAKLEFDHPRTGQRLSFGSPLPEDLKETLEKLRHK